MTTITIIRSTRRARTKRKHYHLPQEESCQLFKRTMQAFEYLIFCSVNIVCSYCLIVAVDAKGYFQTLLLLFVDSIISPQNNQREFYVIGNHGKVLCYIAHSVSLLSLCGRAFSLCLCLSLHMAFILSFFAAPNLITVQNTINEAIKVPCCTFRERERKHYS